jgi:hypothetical protein
MGVASRAIAHNGLAASAGFDTFGAVIEIS